MTNDDAAATGGSTGQAGPAFDTSVAHHARVYDYLLGSKVNVLHTP